MSHASEQTDEHRSGDLQLPHVVHRHGGANIVALEKRNAQLNERPAPGGHELSIEVEDAQVDA